MLICAVFTVGTAAAAASAVYVNTIPGGGAKQRPSFFSVGMGQCSPFYHHLRWTRWGGRSARAIGKISWRDPDFSTGESCATARAISHRVTVKLTRRTTCDGRRYYRRVTTRYGSQDVDCGSSQG